MSYNKLVQATLDTLIDRIAAADEDNWAAGWVGGGLPRNFTTGNRYTGVNVLQLWAEAEIKGYQSQQWATWKQWAGAGHTIKEEERKQSSIIMVYKPLFKKDDHGNTTDEIAGRFFRCYFVYNTEQLEDPPETTTLPGTEMGGYAERMIGLAKVNGISMMEGGGPPSFWPKHNHVCMPDIKQYRTQEGYAHDLAHELAHATGHKSRLNRVFNFDRKSAQYATEELVAELCSAYTCVDMGIPLQNFEHNSASYLVGWAKRAQKTRGTEDDMSHQLVSASKAASAAFEYLVAYKSQEKAA